MNTKPVKYSVHLRGKGTLGEIKYDLDGLDSSPPFRVGDYIKLRSFDYQYERDDSGVIVEVEWDLLSDDAQTTVHQYVIIHELSSGEAAERSSRKKA